LGGVGEGRREGGIERVYSLLDEFIIGLDWNLMIRRVRHLKKEE